MTTKPLWQMTDAEFERWLKRNKMTGMAAASAGMARRRQMKAHDDELREQRSEQLHREYEREEAV